MLSLVRYCECMSNEIERWKRLADFVRTAREALGMTSQAQLAAKAGVAIGTVARLEGGKPHPRVPRRAPAVERALGWGSGTVRGILDGEIREMPVSVPTTLGNEVDSQAYRAAVEQARHLSRREQRRLFADLGLSLGDDPED